MQKAYVAINSFIIVIIVLFLCLIFYVYEIVQELPKVSDLENFQSPSLSSIVDFKGEIIDQLVIQNRIFTPIDQIPDLVKNAFISAEDKNFFAHNGYDSLGLLKALFSAAQGKRLRGASTITQQVTKNFLLSGERSFKRKIKEILLAIRLEKVFNKNKILEIYLNETFLGQNSYGVTVAAKTYFSKTFSELGAAEAAYLASLPKAPDNYHPIKNKDKALARRNFVLKEMAENKYISFQSAEEEQTLGLKTVQNKSILSVENLNINRDYFSDEVRRQLLESMDENYLFGGGLTIKTSLRTDYQELLSSVLQNELIKFDRNQGIYRGPIINLKDNDSGTENLGVLIDKFELRNRFKNWDLAIITDVTDKHALIKIKGVDGFKNLQIEKNGWIKRKHLSWKKPNFSLKASEIWNIGDVIYVERAADKKNYGLWEYRQVPEIQGGMILLEVDSGRILALQGGFSYKLSSLNRVTQALRTPGSLINPFIYAALLDSGINPNLIADKELKNIEIVNQSTTNQGNHGFPVDPIDSISSKESRANEALIYLKKPTLFDYFDRLKLLTNFSSNHSKSLHLLENSLLSFLRAYLFLITNKGTANVSLVDQILNKNGESIELENMLSCFSCSSPIPVADDTRLEILKKLNEFLDHDLSLELDSDLKLSFSKYNISGTLGVSIDKTNFWFMGYRNNLAFGCYVGYDSHRQIRKKNTRLNYCASAAIKIFEKIHDVSVTNDKNKKKKYSFSNK